MKKKIKFIGTTMYIACILIMFLLVGCNSVSDINLIAKCDDKKILLLKEGKWKEYIISGVTMNKTENISIDMYSDWFQKIKEMNANTIQLNDIMEPNFYQALYAYNNNNKNPIYIMQVVSLKKNQYEHMRDAYSGNMDELLLNKAYMSIDTIHEYDLASWTLGYTIGTDWDQDLVLYTNDVCEDRKGYKGKYIETWPTASAFETLLAKVGDKILSYENSKYNEQTLIGYKNWALTDAIFHDTSYSMDNNENLASVNMELINVKQSVKSGVFLDYHVEPSYPFLSYESKYSNYIDDKGKANPFKGYIKQLTKYHRFPIVISDLGIPTSKGVSNIDEVRGYNQGGVSEQKQGEILKSLYEDIIYSDTCGVLIKSWLDDLSQKVWNTNKLVNIDRNKYWSDALTSTQSYGIMSVEPGKKYNRVFIDGNVDEWDNITPTIDELGNKLKIMYDEKYIYIDIELINKYSGNDKIFIPLDITPNSGAKSDITNKVTYDRNMDFIIKIDGQQNSSVLVQNYYDSLYAIYGQELGIENSFIKMPISNTERFEVIKQINRRSMLDNNGDKIDAIVSNIGNLVFGNSNPNSKAFNSLTDYNINENNIEIRIPWGLLNFSDPSQMMIHDDYYKNYGVNEIKINEMFVGLIIQQDERFINIKSHVFKLKGWEDNTDWHMRLKKSYYFLQKVFANINKYIS